jgi:hypothetical protein
LPWLEALTQKEWKLITIMGTEKKYKSMESIIKSSENMKYLIKVNTGRVREIVKGNTIREMSRKSDIFAVHHSQILQSEFVSMEDNTSVTIFDILELDKFFLKNPILGKKFYQNLCKNIFYFYFYFFVFYFYFYFLIFIFLFSFYLIYFF